jgi:rSAM/selenodomain-associated transferase 1
MPNISRVAIAIMAKAPIPGLAKTRLIPTIGAHAAAVLQEHLTERAIATALASNVGPVALWCMPDPSHASFRELVRHHKMTLKRQPDGDLGARMLAAMTAGAGPTLVIGTDCPAITAEHLRASADALRDGADVVLIPAEDGGYVLIGTRSVQPKIFCKRHVWHCNGVDRNTGADFRSGPRLRGTQPAVGRRYRKRPGAPRTRASGASALSKHLLNTDQHQSACDQQRGGDAHGA